MIALALALAALAATPGERAFTFEAQRLPPQVRERVVGVSWREGCPVPLRTLRYLEVAHRGFDGRGRVGELIVHRDAVPAMRRAFGRLFRKRFPIRRMRLVDDYGASDFESIEADNTSAFNCRTVAGTDRWSEHAYGRAIDINPVENPYVQAGSVDPPEGRRYAALDRSAGARVPPGVVVAGDVVVQAVADVGWTWGGTWSSSKDYQHFSLSGR